MKKETFGIAAGLLTLIVVILSMIDNYAIIQIIFGMITVFLFMNIYYNNVIWTTNNIYFRAFSFFVDCFLVIIFLLFNFLIIVPFFGKNTVLEIVTFFIGAIYVIVIMFWAIFEEWGY